MSITKVNTDLTVRKAGEIAHVDDGALEALMSWVVTAASPEELTFENVRFHQVRDWLKAHKAARELRVKAIRIECIALRKVGLAGLAERLTKPNDRRVANWLAGLGEEEFQTILEESDIATTPFAVMKWVTDEEKEVKNWGTRRDTEYLFDEAHGHTQYYSFGLTSAVRDVLEVIVHDQEDFTVAEAADKLWVKLSGDDRYQQPEDHMDLPPDLAGEPLREVVRKVLRAPGPADRVVIGDAVVAVPNYVTFQPGGGDIWKRTPWERAELWQLKMMCDLRREQAVFAEKVADNMQSLYERLEAAQVHSETTRCQDLIAYADLEIEGETV